MRILFVIITYYDFDFTGGILNNFACTTVDSDFKNFLKQINETFFLFLDDLEIIQDKKINNEVLDLDDEFIKTFDKIFIAYHISNRDNNIIKEYFRSKIDKSKYYFIEVHHDDTSPSINPLLSKLSVNIDNQNIFNQILKDLLNLKWISKKEIDEEDFLEASLEFLHTLYRTRNVSLSKKISNFDLIQNKVKTVLLDDTNISEAEFDNKLIILRDSLLSEAI